MKFFLRLLGGNDSTTVEDNTADSGTISGAKTENLTQIVDTISNVLGIALGLIAAAVVILAIFIAFKFFTADTEDKRKNAKQQLIYAIIGIIVLFALIALKQPIMDAITQAV